MASAANGQNITTTPATAFSSALDGGPCQRFYVANRSSSAGNVLVNVPGLHKSGENLGLAPGQAIIFGDGGVQTNGISTVTLSTDSGTATADYGVVAKV